MSRELNHCLSAITFAHSDLQCSRLTILRLTIAEAHAPKVRDGGDSDLLRGRKGPVAPLLSLDGTTEVLNESLRYTPRREPGYLLSDYAGYEGAEGVVLVPPLAEEGTTRHALAQAREARVGG